MLLELAALLKGWLSGFHLFQYITFRAIMSTLTALAVSLLIGPAVIRRAECSNASCGWVYMRTGGTREEFVRAVNERSGERG